MSSDLIAALATPTPGKPQSKMDVWLATRTEPEQAAIRTAASDPQWGHIALRDRLIEYGAPEISESAFRQWRKRLGLK